MLRIINLCVEQNFVEAKTSYGQTQNYGQSWAQDDRTF